MEFQEAVQIIDKRAMEEYEMVRKSGACNMLDIGCVAQVAAVCGFAELEDVADERTAYIGLLENFSALMRNYEITQ